MTREPIFYTNINKITEEKLTDILIVPSLAFKEHYLNFTETLKNNPQISSICVFVDGASEEFLNDFFTIFQNENGEFNIEPSKIVLSGEVDKYNLDIYENIENLILSGNQTKDIKEIKSKFPNLKNIKMQNSSISINDIGDNINNLFDIMKYMKFAYLDKNSERGDIQHFIEKIKLSDKLFLSSDESCLINLDRINKKSFEREAIPVNVVDIEKIGIDKLRQSVDKIVLVINNVSELSKEQLQEYKEAGLQIEGIKVFTPENNIEQNQIYDMETYSAIRDKLEELVEGIDVNLPEKQKFAEVYKRVCSNITYDTIAAYPKNEEEIEYSKAEKENCQNLKNGLLKGKCVCAGYADILRNALAMVNIESKYINGAVINKTINEKVFREEDFRGDYIEKSVDGKINIGEYHAWNKVKIDGVWYNVDASNDATKIRLGQTPTNCLETDEEIKKYSRKVNFGGPECKTPMEKKEIDQMFNNKHLYVGNVMIPNVRDVVALIIDT